MFKTVMGLALSSGLFVATYAHAVPIVDVVNPVDTMISAATTPSPCPAGLTCTPGSITFIHDLTDNGFGVGDAVDSATIQIHLTELVTTGTNHETYSYSIGSQLFSCLHGNCVPNSGVTDTIALTASLADLETDGLVHVTITALSGNFRFADSSLTANITAAPVPSAAFSEIAAAAVPVPSTLLLMLAGLGALSRCASRSSRQK